MNIQQLVARGFGLPEPRVCTPVSGGLINQTFNIDNLWILQHVSPIFGAAVNDDIAALTPVLRAHGVNVPLLCRAADGAWCVEGSRFGLEPGPWRLMTMLDGKTHHFVENIEQIRALTRALASFHRALDGHRYAFQHKRPGVHDFMRHRTALDRAIEEHRNHRLWQKVFDLFENMQKIEKFVDYNAVMVCEDLRIIHGDPKISNFLMHENDVSGVVDLDTMALSRVAFDVGDAIRSWCNPQAEDVEPAFNAEYAREMIGLYQEEAPFISRAERASLGSSAAFISLELAMRFARDALCEDYFGFNPEIGHGEHSLMRARAMYTLCTQML